MARTGSQRKGSQLSSSENAAATAAAASAAANTFDHQNISRKSKFRYLTARGDAFEKQLAELLQSLSGYARRSAKLRDSGDMVAEALNAISVGEVLNPSLKKTTAEMARSMRSIQDHRDSEVLYFEDKLLPALSAFGTSLHKQRDELRSTTNKVFDGKGSDGSRSRWSTAAAAGASSTASRSSSTRRSQSAERVEKPSKEERALQQIAQRYELRRNLVLRKVLLKLILSELRYTIRAFNSLTDVYKAVSRGFSPLDDLKLFNEFFHFRSLNRAILNEVEGDVSDVESAEEEEEDDEDSESEEEEGAEDSDNEEEEESEESGLEEDDTEGDMASETLDGRRSALKKGGGDDEVGDDDDDDDEQFSEQNSITTTTSSRSEQLAAIQSTLRRFNSTPEIPISGGGGSAGTASTTGTSKATSKNKWSG